MTPTDLSTYALCATAVLYGAIGTAFAARGQRGSAVVLYGLALLAFAGALA